MPLTFISFWCIGSCNNVDISTIHHNLVGRMLHLQEMFNFITYNIECNAT